MDIERKPRQGNLRKHALIAAASFALVTAGMAAYKMQGAAPAVDADALVTDTVRRGTLVREVRGAGNLVPEQQRWVPAIVSGRVERRLVAPGSEVKADTVLVELSNPELELELLEAQSDLAAARAALVNLETQLATRSLEQESAVVGLETQLRAAVRTARSADRLEPAGLIAATEASAQRETALDLDKKLDLAQRRLAILERATENELDVQRIQVSRLEKVVQAKERRLSALKIVAGRPGILQDMRLEEGQWVQPGATIARVMQADRLKAEVRVPQMHARDLRVGQSASVDVRTQSIEGQVVRIDPAVENGMIQVEIALHGELPDGLRADQSIHATVEIERLEDVLYIGRPAAGQVASRAALFRVGADGYATRTQVGLGQASIRTIEVTDGLMEGDEVILSDMASWSGEDRLRIR